MGIGFVLFNHESQWTLSSTFPSASSRVALPSGKTGISGLHFSALGATEMEWLYLCWETLYLTA